MNIYDKFALAYVKTIKFIRAKTIAYLASYLFTKKGVTHTKILINRDGAFGDSIVALPALSLIRQSFPSAQIDILTISNSGITFKNLGLEPGLVDNFFVVNKNNRAPFLKQLKENQYDLFIQLPQNLGLYKSIRNMLLVRFVLKINSAFGWDHGRIKAFVRQQKKYLDVPTETQRFLDNMKNAGLNGEQRYHINAIQPQNERVLDLLKVAKPVVFIIGGKRQPKKWPLDNWINLADLIGDKYEILIVGDKDEIEEAEYIISKTKNTTNTCGDLSIPELFYVLKNTAIAVSLDTGAMHLCDAAQTKVIALISTRELTNKWHPNNKASVVIEKVLPCSFCFKTVCADNICMKNITPDEVYTEFSRLY